MAVETLTSQRFERPSRTRKALISVLGGLGIFAASNVYGLVASNHNDRIEDARAEKAQEARKFDITRAKVAWAIDLDKNEQAEEGVE